MSNIKCPFCNKPLQPTFRQSDEYWCENYDCPRTNIEWVGSQKLWQELIRTRKALEIAVKRLGYIKNNYKSWTPDRDAQMIAQAVNGLDEIKTALEQKDK